MTDKLHDDLTRNLNALRAAASRGPVTSREILQMTDGMMDRLSRAALAAAPQPETRAWAVVRGGRIVPHLTDFDKERTQRWANIEKGTLVRVAIRVVEGGDDAA